VTLASYSPGRINTKKEKKKLIQSDMYGNQNTLQLHFIGS